MLHSLIKMGAMCGKPAAEDDGSKPNNAKANGSNGSASSPTTGAGSGGSPQPPQGSVAMDNSISVDEADVKVAVGGNEPELNADVVEKQTTQDEAYSFWDRNKTYKPQKSLPNGRQGTMQATMHATLGGGGELANTVKLPEGEDLNEWIAVNTVHFFNATSMIYGTCAPFCTEESCPTMSAGKAEYLWKDGVNYKKPTRVPAPVYIDLLLSWADERISNPQLFPVDADAKFPRNFMTEVKNIYKRLFRLYAHLYCTHSEKIRSIGANAHLNTCFKHFIYFVLEFNLMDSQEMQPLEKLINKLKQSKK